jgi:hypothetical protein
MDYIEIDYDAIFTKYKSSIYILQINNLQYIKVRIAEIKNLLRDATIFLAKISGKLETKTDEVNSLAYAYIVKLTKKESSERNEYDKISDRNVRLDLKKHYIQGLEQHRELINLIKQKSMWDKITSDLIQSLVSLSSLLRKTDKPFGSYASVVPDKLPQPAPTKTETTCDSKDTDTSMEMMG